jgi:hypothetical protein
MRRHVHLPAATGAFHLILRVSEAGTSNQSCRRHGKQ